MLDLALAVKYEVAQLVLMPDRSRKRRPADPNQMATSIVQEATADQPEAKEKNPGAPQERAGS
jgi:hypothetical protein